MHAWQDISREPRARPCASAWSLALLLVCSLFEQCPLPASAFCTTRVCTLRPLLALLGAGACAALHENHPLRTQLDSMDARQQVYARPHAGALLER